MKESDHPRYGEVFKYIQSGDVSFASYQETFERLVAERCIMTGSLVSIQDINLSVDEEQHTNFARLVGVSQYAIHRMRISVDFLDLLASAGRQDVLRLERYKSTQYYKDLMARISNSAPRQKHANLTARAGRRVEKFAKLYENMALNGGIVGSALSDYPSDSLTYNDIPWAIDYGGYVKRMDGAHRRAIAAFLGHQTIPTLVFRIESIDDDLLEDSCEYLKKHFSWFRDLLAALRSL